MNLDEWVADTPLSKYLKLISHKPTKRPPNGAVWAYAPEVKAKAIELYQSGRPIMAVARELGVNEKTLHGWLKHAGVWKRTLTQWSEEEKRAALDLIALWQSTTKVSRFTGIPCRTIESWMSLEGIKLPPVKHPDELIAKGKDMLREGAGVSEVARELGLSPSTVRNWKRSL